MTLFHYCSIEGFHAILSNRSIRLSALAQSNDFKEGKLVAESVGRLCARDQLDEVTTSRMQSDIELMESLFSGLGFCMSQDGDLLSQWRGYADNGRGFSIGFSESYLSKLCGISQQIIGGGMYLTHVEYDEKAHDALVEPT